MTRQLDIFGFVYIRTIITTTRGPFVAICIPVYNIFSIPRLTSRDSYTYPASLSSPYNSAVPHCCDPALNALCPGKTSETGQVSQHTTSQPANNNDNQTCKGLIARLRSSVIQPVEPPRQVHRRDCALREEHHNNNRRTTRITRTNNNNDYQGQVESRLDVLSFPCLSLFFDSLFV